MHVIQLEALEPGVYNDHKADHITVPQEGWAMIPPDMELPSTFPRLGEKPETAYISYPYEVEEEQIDEITGEKTIVKVQKERSILTVTKMVEGTLPEPVIPEPTEAEQLRADVDFLLIMQGV